MFTCLSGPFVLSPPRPSEAFIDEKRYGLRAAGKLCPAGFRYMTVSTSAASSYLGQAVLLSEGAANTPIHTLQMRHLKGHRVLSHGPCQNWAYRATHLARFSGPTSGMLRHQRDIGLQLAGVLTIVRALRRQPTATYPA
jgi:hypothetical protein